MTKDARAVLRSIYQQLGVGHRVLAQLFGRDQNTVQKHLAGKVIPEGTRNWLANIESITLQPGYAVIIIDMPVDVPTAELSAHEGAKHENRPSPGGSRSGLSRCPTTSYTNLNFSVS